uniref:SOSS complex subunit A homolog n=1 Tax=Timema tahoe TaxID=61484 RepID=A0A7R9FI63_9NEOP|nr:unnamed protein product [Timema tahoe]
MDQSKTITPKLFVVTAVENKDELEEKYERCYNALQNLISGLSDKEAQNALNNAVCKEKNHEDLSLGLIFVILTKPQSAAKTYRDLTLITRDGLGLVLNSLSHLILERYLRLTDVSRSQVLWLLREMMRNAVTNVETLCLNLMRHAAGGDVSQRNVVLIESLLDIYQENRSWLDKFPVLITSVVYTYLRLIEDHSGPKLAELRQKEVTFVVALVRERFGECLTIGRDFVRLLQNVARIPEFDKLWKDILLKPKTLCPNFTGILQLLQTRTSRRFFQSRLTPEMERKLVFLTSSVRFGFHKRYQEWFQRQYLATQESQSLRCDLIRFIVGVIHPTNELLCSDIIPRWAVIGWLITTCTSSVAGSNAKLALFYDWLFFDAEKDNIMNIGDVLAHIKIIPNFYPALSDKVRAGIFSSLQQILEKRVLPSLGPLFDSKNLDRDLRVMVREVFKEFCVPPSEGVKMEEFPSIPTPPNMKDEPVGLGGPHINHASSPINNHVGGESEPMFSDDDEDRRAEEDNVIEDEENVDDDEDDDDIPLAKVRLKDKPSDDKSPSLDPELVQQLDGEFRRAVESLHVEKDNEARCQAMERLVQLVLQEDDLDTDIMTTLGSCLCHVLREQFDDKVFPKEMSDEVLSMKCAQQTHCRDTTPCYRSIEDSIGRPLFVMFRNVVQMPDDSRRLLLLNLLGEMATQRPQIGYLLLYFLKAWPGEFRGSEIDNSRNTIPPALLPEGLVSSETQRWTIHTIQYLLLYFLKACKLNEAKAQVYIDLAQSLEKDLEKCLLADLKLCQEDDVELFCWLVPEVYTQFPQVAVGHAQLLSLVVSTVDASQLQCLVCHILQGRLVMFRADSFRALLSASLSWETYEQYCLWQLVTAHGIPIDYVLPILPRLEFSTNAEALTSILLMLKQERPTAELLKHLLSREVRPPGDVFVLSTLKYWCREHEEKLGELISALLSSRYPNTSPNKRKRGGGGKGNATSGPPTADQVLGHLDQLRQSSCRLYGLDSIQRALQQAQASCSDSQRKRFGDLFALAEVDEVETTSKKRGVVGRKGKGAGAKSRAPAREVSDTSEESSEEEEIVKPKHAKKRKKVIPVGSDSD